MSDESIFIDTNILLYAHDLDEEDKSERANRLLIDLWTRRVRCVISVQVIHELFVNLIRKDQDSKAAFDIVEPYLSWDIVNHNPLLFTQAVKEMERWRTSFWDGLILAAARRAAVDFLWSEDFNPGKDYGGILVLNPLLDVQSKDLSREDSVRSGI